MSKVQVTMIQEDLQHGTPRDEFQCALAQTLERTFCMDSAFIFSDVQVTYDDLTFSWDDGSPLGISCLEITTPEEVATFIKQYDLLPEEWGEEDLALLVPEPLAPFELEIGDEYYAVS